MRLPTMLALLLALLTLMGCVLQTPAPEETAEPGATAEAATPAAAEPGRTPPSDTPTPPPTSTIRPGGASPRSWASPPAMALEPQSDYFADFRTNYGNFRVRLLAVETPATVNNFVFLAQQGFYDGLIFHRVIPEFMIQGGDPTGTGRGGPGYRFADEIVPGFGFDAAGKLAMANAGPNTNGSQFFITVAPTPWLDGRHTIFGEIIEGQPVVDAISQAARNRNDAPLRQVVIESIEITKSPR